LFGFDFFRLSADMILFPDTILFPSVHDTMKKFILIAEYRPHQRGFDFAKEGGV
jgi:hypothetical protein